MPPLSQRDVASVLGRTQGPEKFVSIPFAPGGSNYIQRVLNLTRPLESLHFVLRIRARFVDHSMVTIAAEAPQTLLQRLRIQGTHREWSNLTPVDLTGATMFAWNQLWNPKGNSVYMSTNGGPVIRLPQLGTPIQSLVAGTTFGKVNDYYDLEIHWDLPVTPLFPPAKKGVIAPFYWYPQDWADTIQIQPFFGDAASFGSIVGDGGDVEFTDYGSDSGVGTFDVYANYTILSSLANAMQSAVCVRSTNTVQAPVQSVSVYSLIQLLQKQKTLNVVLKAGTAFTGNDLQPGVQVFRTLSDTMLANTQIVLDNKRIRDNQSNMSQKEFVGRQFASVFPQGYLPFSFDDSQNPLTAFRGDNVPGGSTYGVFSDVTSAGSDQYCEVVQEQVYGDPGLRGQAG
jgi:hypothetical protein